ncbi:hypothetical protein [Spirosoma horti]
MADGVQENNYSGFSCETLSCNSYAHAFFHMNWGWKENYNGWYALQEHNPGAKTRMATSI